MMDQQQEGKTGLPAVLATDVDDGEPVEAIVFTTSVPSVKNPFLSIFEQRPVERFLGMTRPRLFSSGIDGAEQKLMSMLTAYQPDQGLEVCLQELLKIDLIASRLGHNDIVGICEKEFERIHELCPHRNDDHQWVYRQVYAHDITPTSLPTFDEVDFERTILQLQQLLLDKKNSKLNKTILASRLAEIAAKYEQHKAVHGDDLVNFILIWCGHGYSLYEPLLDELIHLLHDMMLSSKLDDVLWHMVELVAREMHFMRLLLDHNYQPQQREMVVAYKDAYRFMQSMLAKADYLDRLYLFELLYKLERALEADLGDDEQWLINLLYVLQSAICGQVQGYYDDDMPECLQQLYDFCTMFAKRFSVLGPMGRYAQGHLQAIEAEIKKLKQMYNLFEVGQQSFKVKLLGGIENVVYLLTPMDLPDMGLVLRLEKHPKELENMEAINKISKFFPEFIGKTFLNNELKSEVYHACSYGQYYSGGTLESYITHLHAMRPNGLLLQDKVLLLNRLGFMLKKLDALHHKHFISFPDIKPSNLFLIPKKSADLAVSDVKSFYQFPSKTLLTTRVCGSPDYAAPEMGLGDLERKPYSPFAADYYALGRTFEHYLLGDERKRCIKDFAPSYEIDYLLSQLIQQLTCEDPKQRLRYAWDMLSTFAQRLEEAEIASRAHPSPTRTRSLENKKTPASAFRF